MYKIKNKEIKWTLPKHTFPNDAKLIYKYVKFTKLT